jgi:hypothetical protein
MTETRRYRGTLALHSDGEGDDILFLDDAAGNYDHPLAEDIAEDIGQYGHYLAVRYWTAAVPRRRKDMIEGAIREMLGAGEAEFGSRYSEVTGYLWTDEDIMVGGHDLLEELKSQAGRYCLLEISYSKEDIA